jgi:hypothetical protein
MTVFEATEVLARGQSVQARGLADLRRLNNRYAVLVDLYGELCEAYVLSLEADDPAASQLGEDLAVIARHAGTTAAAFCKETDFLDWHARTEIAPAMAVLDTLLRRDT